MTQASAAHPEGPAQPSCPVAGCGRRLERRGETWFCQRHALGFGMREFTPFVPPLDRVDTASNQHAVCAHHPGHSAVAICAGTGNYICGLCTVDIDGATYSVQFLDSAAGKSLLAERFANSLPRPDRMVWQLQACLLIPLFTAILLLFAFVFVPLGAIYWIKVIRLRQRNALYRRIVRLWHAVAMLAGLMIWAALGLALWIAIYLHAYRTGGL